MDNYSIDLMETLGTIRRIGLKLSLKSYTFIVTSSKFLRHVISSQGLQANPEKFNILAEMRSLRTLKQV